MRCLAAEIWREGRQKIRTNASNAHVSELGNKEPITRSQEDTLANFQKGALDLLQTHLALARRT